MALFTYTGPDRALYAFLLTDGGVAPYTMHYGESVDFGETTPPPDGHWMLAEPGAPARLPDNDPDYAYPQPHTETGPNAASPELVPEPADAPPNEPGQGQARGARRRKTTDPGPEQTVAVEP